MMLIFQSPMQKANLMVYSYNLADTLKVLERQGLEIIKEEYGPIKDTYRLEIYPVFHCPECNRLSAPRAFCLWCTPAEDEGGKG